ncbi:hypothetical protein [Calidithermus timidus]|jgi:hypothetical protein|uniref:hypothetical protein n=1 Tax=Calidithermus timidus TaxID=307124 RepID=UPI00036417BA|nr:hypothetical protein [Calidithermus timidus]
MQATVSVGIAEVERLISEGQRLQRRLGELGEVLRQTALQLEQGTPAQAGVTTQLVEVSKLLEGWYSQAERLLGRSPDELVLPKVMEALYGHKHQLELAQIRQQALEVLEEISALSYQGSEEFLPLSGLQFDALSLLRDIQTAAVPGETARALAAGKHPYNALLRLALEPSLSNEEWLSLLQYLSQELGSELAVAAARRQLTRSGG